MKVIKYLELNIVLEVEEEEKAGRQTKFYGKVIESDDLFYMGLMFETPFLYKSGFKVIRGN